MTHPETFLRTSRRATVAWGMRSPASALVAAPAARPPGTTTTSTTRRGPADLRRHVRDSKTSALGQFLYSLMQLLLLLCYYFDDRDKIFEMFL